MTETLDYANVRIGLRAPRVAIVFEGADTGWHFFARHALAQANRQWGGAGFVVVPHNDGMVSGTILRAVAAYDPDYVVVSPIALGDFESALPGAFPFGDLNGMPLTGAPRAEAVERLTDQSIVPPTAEVARDLVSRVCNPYRRTWPLEDGSPAAAADDAGKSSGKRWDTGWDERWDEDLQSLDGDKSTGAITRLVSFAGQGDPMCLAAPANLTGPIGAAIAAVTGMLASPALNSDDSITGDMLQQLVTWITRRPLPPGDLPNDLVHHHAGLTLAVHPRELPSAWSRTTVGLSPVYARWSRNQCYVVVGDTADDFALATILERLYGNAIWLHSDWSPLGDGPLAKAARHSLAQLVGFQGQQRRIDVRITSATLPTSDLETLLTALTSDAGVQAGQDLSAVSQESSTGVRNERDRSDMSGEAESTAAANRPRSRRQRVEIEQPLQWSPAGQCHWGVTDQFESRIALPVHRDADGGTDLVSPLPATMPTDSVLAANADLTWQVDVDLDTTAMPTGRGLDGHLLVPTEDGRTETWVRTGRSSISFHSSRWDFVSSLANREQRLARPRLRGAKPDRVDPEHGQSSWL